jgi:hypothetical protein
MAREKCVVCGRARPEHETIVIVPYRSLHLVGASVVIPRGQRGRVCALPSCMRLLHKIDVAPRSRKG